MRKRGVILLPFGRIGIWELVLILGLVLLLFGPRKLPELGKSIGRTLKEFRRSSSGFDDEVMTIEEETEESVKDVKG